MRRIIGGMLVAIIVFLVGALFSASFDVTKWEEPIRILIGCGIICCVLIPLMLNYLDPAK